MTLFYISLLAMFDGKALKRKPVSSDKLKDHFSVEPFGVRQITEESAEAVSLRVDHFPQKYKLFSPCKKCSVIVMVLIIVQWIVITFRPFTKTFQRVASMMVDDEARLHGWIRSHINKTDEPD